MIPLKSSIVAAVPATLFALFGRFLPNSKLKLVAAPTPVISPIARQIVVSGKATFVAAFPKKPDFLSNKNLIHNIVKSINQVSNDSRNRK